MNQFRGQIGQALHLAFSIAILDSYRLSIHIAEALQALEQRTNRIDLWRVEEQDCEPWNLSRLRARTERSRGHRTANTANELATLHWTLSNADLLQAITGCGHRQQGDFAEQIQ